MWILNRQVRPLYTPYPSPFPRNTVSFLSRFLPPNYSFRNEETISSLTDLLFIEIVPFRVDIGIFRVINERLCAGGMEGGTQKMGHYVTRTRIATLIPTAPLFSFTFRREERDDDDDDDEF